MSTVTVSPALKDAALAETGVVGEAGEAAVPGGDGLSENSGVVDDETQPDKIIPANKAAQADNNGFDKSFMGANPCENSRAINTFV
jgi:hypothetical protein